ncbi:putative leader peptide [Catellatospora tritici]
MTLDRRCGHEFHAILRRHIDLARVSSALCRAASDR